MKPNNLRPGMATYVLWLLLSVNLAHAANQKSIGKVLTLGDVQHRIQTIEEKKNLPEEAKNRILAAYRETEDNLNELDDLDAQAESYKRALSSLPIEAKQLARQIAEAESNLKNRKSEKLTGFPTDELEQRLLIEKTRLSDLDAEIGRTEAALGELSGRPQIIREKVSEIKSKQASSQQEQQSLSIKAGDSLSQKEAREIQLDSRIRVLNSTLKALELENLSNPLRLQVNKDRVHLLTLQREHKSLVISDLDNLLLDRRQQETDKEQAALLQAEKEAEGKHPLIRAATKENMALNRSLQEINKNMEQYLLQKNEIDVRYKQLERDFQSAEQKISLAGLSPALGNLLREQRRNVPQRKQYNTLSEEIQDQIALASLEMFKLDEARKSLADTNQVLLTRIAELPVSSDDGEKLRVRTELRMLLNDQKDLVLRLAAGYNEYARVLGDVDFSLQQMLAIADKFSSYLDQRLLWVPSAPVIDLHFPQEFLASVLWFVSPHNWLGVVSGVWASLSSRPLLALVGLSIVIFQWRFRAGVKRRLADLLNKKTVNHEFSEILSSLVYLLILSLPVALLMVWLALVLKFHVRADLFSHAFAEGLIGTAESLCVVQFVFRLFKPDGVAEVLFQWPQHATRLLYSQMKWARFIVIPCVFITAMAGSDLFSEHSHALGRSALMVMMLMISYLLHRLTQPLTGLGKYFYQQSSGWLSNLRYVWYGVAVLTPLIIIGFAVAGYYQSALELQEKLLLTLRLLFVTVLFQGLVLRWLRNTERQLALKNAHQKRKQVEQAAVSTANLEGGYLIEEQLLDITKINQQSHKLLTTIVLVITLVGFWMIWNDILPALTVFDQIVLWQDSKMLEGKEILEPITLINLLICLAYSGLAFIFASNFPALVDLITAGKFAMTAGSRYALIQLVRYSLIAFTFLAVANELGGSWSQVQWLVAALSVGLGFGLQEIFANMVSGIILLFERPIRVGDTVTVGDVTGRVSQIQMRATHIVDWDRKELVVPNKTFITDRLINWTLSDTVTRLVIPIGVAYGSNLETVEQILTDAVKSIEQVLSDPEPTVVFVGFGDSVLQFKINLFVRELSDRVLVTHHLHTQIYAALMAHHIEIPYPQRDVHIRSVEKGILKD